MNENRPFWNEMIRALRRALPEHPTKTIGQPQVQIPVKPPRTVFILMGGGAHGASQAGVLSVLSEAGIQPDLIVGVSAGAWNGSFWSFDPTPERAHILEEIWKSTSTNDILGTIRWRAAVSAFTNRGTLYDVDGLQRMAERHIGGMTFSDLKIPLHILSVNVSLAKPVILSYGPLLRSVLASAAIPGIFPPIIINGDYFVDGGIMESAACDDAIAFGATTVYLISCGAMTQRMSRIDTLTGLLNRSFEVSGIYNFQMMVEKLRHANIHVIPMMPEIPHTSPLDFEHGAALIQAGRETAQRALATHHDIPIGPQDALPSL